MFFFIQDFNKFIFWFLTIAYGYQLFYLAYALFSKNKCLPTPAKRLHRYGVVVAARNESSVIGELIQNIKHQKYPSKLVDVFVVADNCTDDTAEVARRAGAIVYERFDRQLVGKGYALDYLFKRILEDHRSAGYEAFFIFDADNLIDPSFISEMNKVFDRGYRVITSYRNSKNFATNWITAGYSLWFLREARFLNHPRMCFKTSCAVSGTGFLISADIIQRNNGWNYHLLTEDIEFSVDCALRHETIGYCPTAVIYDEQPETFQQSWIQRLRWSKGFYQVTRNYGGSLIRGVFQKNRFALSCYDMLLTIAPATLLTLFCVCVNAMILFVCFVEPPLFVGRIVRIAANSLLFTVVNFYLIIFLFAAVTTVTEWRQIAAPAHKKLLYLFTFPVFIFTYIPISICALLQKVEWKPISHSVVKTLNEVQ